MRILRTYSDIQWGIADFSNESLWPEGVEKGKDNLIWLLAPGNILREVPMDASIKMACCLGENCGQTFENIKRVTTLYVHSDNMEEAFMQAQAMARKGDQVILSCEASQKDLELKFEKLVEKL